MLQTPTRVDHRPSEGFGGNFSHGGGEILQDLDSMPPHE